MSRPRPRAKPLADLLPEAMGPALASQGFTGSDIVASWAEIVGDRLAAYCAPIKVDWPRRDRKAELDRRPEPATLVVRVEGAFALELQHLAPLVLERVNAHYGWRCVGRLVLKQGRVTPRARRHADPQAPSAEAPRRVAAATTGIDTAPLAAALTRLGESVIGDGEAERHAPRPGLARP